MLVEKEMRSIMVTRVKSVAVGKLSRVSRQRASKAKSAGTSSNLSPVARSDGVMFSSDARTIGRADEAISRAPEVRVELLEPIREAVASGRYHVSSLDVADKILRQVLMDRKQSL